MFNKPNPKQDFYKLESVRSSKGEEILVKSIEQRTAEIVDNLENNENISEIEIDNAKIRIKIEKNNE